MDKTSRECFFVKNVKQPIPNMQNLSWKHAKIRLEIVVSKKGLKQLMQSLTLFNSILPREAIIPNCFIICYTLLVLDSASTKSEVKL